MKYGSDHPAVLQPTTSLGFNSLEERLSKPLTERRAQVLFTGSLAQATKMCSQQLWLDQRWHIQHSFILKPLFSNFPAMMIIVDLWLRGCLREEYCSIITGRLCCSMWCYHEVHLTESYLSDSVYEVLLNSMFFINPSMPLPSHGRQWSTWPSVLLNDVRFTGL